MTMYSTSNNYYVYTYFDTRPEKNNVPIYVGKGKGRRSTMHLRSSHNSMLNAKIAKMKSVGLQPIISVVYFDTEDEAFNVEKCLIKQYGRIDLGTGTLCNFTDGGEGHAGLIRSADSTARATATTKALMATSEYKLEHSSRMKAAQASAESKAKLSAASKARRSDSKLNAQIVEQFKLTMRNKRRLKYPHWTEEDHLRHEEMLIAKKKRGQAFGACQ